MMRPLACLGKNAARAVVALAAIRLPLVAVAELLLATLVVVVVRRW